MIRRFVATNAKHFANFLSFVVTRCLVIAVFAVSVPIFINQTSGEEYGIVAIGFSLLGLSTLLDVGIGFVITQSVGRSLARSNRRHAVIISQLYWVYLFAAIAISVSALAILSLFSTLSRDENIFYGWLALILPFLATSGTVAAVFQAHNDLVYLNGSRFLFDMAKSAAFLIAGLIFHSHVAIGPTLIAFAAIRAVIDVIYLNRRLGYSFCWRGVSALRRVRRLVVMGIPAMASVLLTVAVNIFDKVLVARWFSREAVTYYSLAFDLNSKAYLIMHALNSAMFASLLRAHAAKKSQSSQIKVGLLAVTAVSCVFYLPFSVFAKEIISIWVNPTIAESSAPLAKVMAFASIAYLYGNVFENALLAKGRANSVFVIYSVAVLSYFVSLFIVPRFLGLIGFMWAYLLLCGLFCAGAVLAYQRSYVPYSKGVT